MKVASWYKAWALLVASVWFLTGSTGADEFGQFCAVSIVCAISETIQWVLFEARENHYSTEMSWRWG